MSASQATVHAGPELAEIEPEIIGFTALSPGHEGPKKLKLLPSPWPADNLPPASATLLSIASKRGLLAAASPDKLVIASTDNIRRAFQEKADDKDVVTNFKPDTTILISQLRHIAFSTDEDYLVVSPERGGGLSVYAVDELLKGSTDPGNQIATNGIPIRVLLPNPEPTQAHLMAVVWDSGRLDITHIKTGETTTVHNTGVTCVSWSLKGKAFVAGFSDGTAAIHLLGSLDQIKGKVPRPPEVDATYASSAVCWLNNEELFVIHAPANPDDEQTVYHFVSTNKAYSSFTFRKTAYELVFPSVDGPTRIPPPRFSIQRLRKWDSVLDEMLIVTSSHSADVGVVIRTLEPIDPQVSTAKEFQMATLVDSRKATAPRDLADTGDSGLIGEALDLSSKEKVLQPSRRLDEITESPTPLPAYCLLTHEGLLVAWWVVWDKSLEAGTAYPGLTHKKAIAGPATPAPAATPASTSANPPSSLFQAASQPASLFGGGRPTPTFASPSSIPKPSNPSFGKPSFPSATSTPGQAGGVSFGTPGFGSNQPKFSLGSGTGATGGQGGFSRFSSGASGGSAFSSLGGGKAPGGSAFSSFASNKDGQSAFASLGQQKAPLSSFGSTVSVDSKLSGVGSTLPSFSNTPGQQNTSIFNSGGTSSFQSFTSTLSGSSGADLGNRERDEATPTPQAPPQQATGLFGGQKFSLGTTFKPDGTAKDDGPKPDTSSGSIFGNAFSSALSSTTSKPPATPVKSDPDKATPLPSTTPATAPRPSTGFFSGTRPESATPKAPPPKPIPEDAPLPPDFITTKLTNANDDIPPLAGSPPVTIDAPSSSDIPSSPLDNENEEGSSEAYEDEEDDQGDDVSEELDDESSEETEAPPADERHEAPTADERREAPQPGTGWSFQNVPSETPTIFPAAPTPPQTLRNAPSNRSQSLAATPAFSGTRRDPLRSPVQPPDKALTPQPVFSDLVDDEDDRIRQELESEIEPSGTLGPFVARQEYAAIALNKTGHAAQIEIVYRDINSMVDTLGLNSRSLKAFIEFHERSQRYTELTRSSLEEVLDEGQDGAWVEKWSLSEIEDLKDLEDQLEQEMDEGRAKGVLDKLSTLARMEHENAKLLSKVNVERRRLINSKEPDKIEALRKASLPKELADQQKALRNDYAQLLTLLSKAEDALILLRSKLASHNAENGRTNAVPSVEAIKKTVNKLIDITKEKNHQITLLEAQLRKVALNEPNRPTSSSSLQATPQSTRRRIGAARSAAARNESPFATPATTKSKMTIAELNRIASTPEPETPSKGYGLAYTPRGSPSADEHNLAALADRVDDDLDNLRETAKRRKNIAESLASALAQRGVKKTTVA